MLPPSHRCWLTAKTLPHRETQAEEVPLAFHVLSVPVPEDRASRNTTPSNQAQDSQLPATASDGTVSHRLNPHHPKSRGSGPHATKFAQIQKYSI